MNLPHMAWWRQFNDKQLDKLVDLAVKNNNDIQMAVGNVLDAQGQLMQVKYSIIPPLKAMLVGNAQRVGDPFPGSNIFMLNGGLQTSLQLGGYTFNLFQYLRKTEQANAVVLAAESTRDTASLAVITQTIAGYFMFAGQSLLQNQQGQLVSDLKELLYLSKMQYKEGLISLYTLQQFEQDYLKAKAELPIVKNNVVVSRNAIRLLLNENPGNIGIGSRFMAIKSDGLVLSNIPSQVLKNRPDVRAAEQKLIASNAQIGVVTSVFFPFVDLTQLGGTVSNQLTNLFGSNSGYWNHTTSVFLPLIAPEYPGMYKSATALRYRQYRDYIQVIRAAFKSVDDDLSAHQQYYDNLVAQRGNFSSSKKAYTLATSSYKEGLYSYPTLLVNKVNMDKAAIELTKSKIAQLTTIVKLYDDLGAGYAYNRKTIV